MTRRLVLSLVWLMERLATLAPLVCRVVPEKFALACARPIGGLIRIGKRKEVLARVPMVIGGEPLAGRRAQQFWSAHLAHIGRSIIEAFYYYRLPDDQLISRIALTGEEHLARVLARGRGAILFVNHFGSPGAIVAGMGLRGYDLTMAGNPLDITMAGQTVPLKRLENILQRTSLRFHVPRVLLGDRLPQRLAETLARNGLFALFVDFPVIRKHNQILNFGSARMNINLGPAILALRNHAAVLNVTSRRINEIEHQLTIHPPLDLPAGPKEAAAGQLMQASLDQLVVALRAQPDQWWPWDWAQISPRE